MTAIGNQTGTVIYEVTEQDLQNAFSGEDNLYGNIWIQKAIEELGFDVLNMNNSYLIGSAIINGVLYILDTDGEDVNIKEEDVFPEDLLEQYNLSALSSFIQPPTPEVIQYFIPEDEDGFNLSMFDWDNWSLEMNDDFTKLVEDYNKLHD